jgi:ribosomal protein S18 acetylase RimI-like enzyme
MLFERTLQSAALYPGVRRIEGQLLAISFQPRQQILFERRVEIFPRLYMLHRDLDKIPTLGPEPEDIRFLLWSDGRLDTAAELIAEAYVGHVDGRINDQYRSYTGARRFLTNTTQHTGCGEFLERASLLALQPMSYKPEGLCLASRIDHATGHITQLCVGSRRRRDGIGAQLLSRSMLAQRELGINTVTLTVTENNTQAVKLYERFQFTVARRFPAFVWETP